jgi:hypothetical protein
MAQGRPWRVTRVRWRGRCRIAGGRDVARAVVKRSALLSRPANPHLTAGAPPHQNGDGEAGSAAAAKRRYGLLRW